MGAEPRDPALKPQTPSGHPPDPDASSATAADPPSSSTPSGHPPDPDASSATAADPPSSSIDFGSPSALAQIRSLTDVGAMTRLLHECIAYQRSLDLRLESLLSQRPDLDRHLSSLHRSTHLLDLARDDAHLLLDSVLSTSSLADNVSRKVRELDLAQSRVSTTLSRIDAIVERSHCLDAARRALDAEDFPSAANAVHSFLQIDKRFDLEPGSERSQLMELKSRLETLVRSRLATAISNRDHPAVLRYIQIFPPLGIQDEGLQLYVSYLRKVIALRSRLEFEHLTDLATSATGRDFISCLTGLFKDIVLAVEENDDVLHGLSGDDGIIYTICELQEECESRGTQILKKYMGHRRLARLASEINTYSKNLLSVGTTEGPDPKEVETFLEEILTLTQLGEDYTEFMVSKIRNLGSLKDDLASRATTTFRSGNFSKVVQELTGFYVILEEFFMVENVRKALSIDEYVSDSMTTSMVDDVFYVLQSCCRRAVSTASSNSVLAVISGAMNLLSNEYQEALQSKMRESSTGGRLFLGGVGVQKTGEEIAVALNNVDVSAEYVLKLRLEIEEQCLKMFPAPADREKVKSCLSELTELNSGFKQLLNAGIEQLVGMVTPRIRPVLDNVATISYELSDAEYEAKEDDAWVDSLLHAAESNIVWLQPLLTSNNYDSVVHLVIDFVVKRLEVIMMQKRFNQLGGLQLDREVRSLVNGFSEMSQRPVRDKFARLSQMSTILNFDRVSEILDFWGENAGHMTWLLTPSEVRRVLGLRVDFKTEAIAALRL